MTIGSSSSPRPCPALPPPEPPREPLPPFDLRPPDPLGERAGEERALAAGELVPLPALWGGGLTLIRIVTLP